MFVEFEGKKDPNSVCSFLYSFLDEKLKEMPDVRHIILFSDSYGGQNKNIIVLKFYAWFSSVFNVTMKHFFLVRGHFFNQCNRNFEIYGNTFKNVETVECPEQYLAIINQSRLKPKLFEAVMASQLIVNWVSALEPLFCKRPKSKGCVFRIQKYAILRYTPTSFFVSQNYS